MAKYLKILYQYICITQYNKKRKVSLCILFKDRFWLRDLSLFRTRRGMQTLRQGNS